MFFWKLDEETIRCLINRQEIDDMGYNLKELSEDTDLMGEFLNHIMIDSQKYVEWNTENGIQTYVARSLPGEQFLLTISCTLVDESINRDLDQIKRMTEELTQTVTPERIDEIYQLTGEEKEQAFHELTMDLQSVYTGKAKKENEESDSHTTDIVTTSKEDADHTSGQHDKREQSTKKDDTEKLGPKILAKSFVFRNFEHLVRFAKVVEKRDRYFSSLYRLGDEYHLIVDFTDCEDNTQAIAFIITAEEYGGVCKDLAHKSQYLSEHGKMMLCGQTLSILESLA